VRLTEIKLTNFRAYRDDSRIRVEPLTALVGRNDVGKSTVFDALGAFLGHELCQLEAADRCVYAAPEAECAITCVFDDLPETLVIDETARTTLRDEYEAPVRKYLEQLRALGNTQ
jgi:putative ATP-dependent endonuclease of OLD family